MKNSNNNNVELKVALNIIQNYYVKLIRNRGYTQRIE